MAFPCSLEQAAARSMALPHPGRDLQPNSRVLSPRGSGRRKGDGVRIQDVQQVELGNGAEVLRLQ